MTSRLTYRAGVPDDWPAVAALLEASSLPLDGVREHLDGFLLGFLGERLVASAGLERYGRTALLRSVATADLERGRGAGEEVVRRLLDRARDDAVEVVVLLTTTASNYFPRFGFRQTTRDAVPEAVRDSVEFRTACPASAVVMQLDLGAGAVLVRRARAEDAAAIANIYNQGIEDRATLETAPRSREERAAWLAARGPRHPVLVAVRNAAVLGWVALSPFNAREAYRFVADLGIYVRRDVRGKGVGTRLVADALDRARALGYHKVVLTTFPTLTQAQALYEKVGFRHVGDYREQGRLDGRWVDTRVMELVFTGDGLVGVDR